MRTQLFYPKTLLALLLACAIPAFAADNSLIKSAYAPPSASPGKPDAAAGLAKINKTRDVLVFSAPPRETPEVGMAQYGPIAEYLTRTTGKKFEYRHPDNWLQYQASIQQDEYDLVFDGPHFVSWRVANRQHTPLVKIPGDFIFVFLTKKDNRKVNTVADLAGHGVCGHAPPNQGTLRLYSMFDNPSRQPQLRNVKGWRNIYKAMVDGKCDGAVVPLKIYKKMDPKGVQAKVLHVTDPAPGQAFTASSRISPQMRKQIAKALLSPEGEKATATLRKRFPTTAYVEAREIEYQNTKDLLKDSWGFNN